MITTLTPNPSFDRTLSVGRIERGGVARASTVRVECAGKGVNVARALNVNGHAARAVFPGNSRDAAAFTASLAEDGAEARPVPTRGAIRTNVTLTEPDGTTTKINEPGPDLSASESESLLDAAVAASVDSDWLVASGSLPPGAPPDCYARLAAMLPDAAERLSVDTSGKALAALVGTACALVKPNLAELAGVTHGGLRTVGDVIDAAQTLRRRGWDTVLVSLGRGGALLVADEVCHGVAPTEHVRNTVGAGDALLAGFVSAGARGPAALAEGLAWARASIRSPGAVGAAVGANDRRGVAVTPEPPRDCPVEVFA